MLLFVDMVLRYDIWAIEEDEFPSTYFAASVLIDPVTTINKATVDWNGVHPIMNNQLYDPNKVK